jgi:hypothetical protein
MNWNSPGETSPTEVSMAQNRSKGNQHAFGDHCLADIMVDVKMACNFGI